jgi:hypothetical protein
MIQTPFTYDGHGINDGSPYRSRVLNFVKNNQEEGGGYKLPSQERYAIGTLLAAAPEMLNVIEQLVHDLAQWEGAKNPEFFPSMKHGRDLVKRLKGV